MASVARSSLDLTTASLLSVASHLVIGFGVLLVIHLGRGEREPPMQMHPASAPEPESSLTFVELPPALGTAKARSEANATPTAVAGAGATVARLDQQKAGRGGDGRSLEAAINLADQDDKLSRVSHTMTSLEQSQHNRLRTAKLRRSWENFRASREPMELTFVAMGDSGSREQRGPEARFDPASGALTSQARNSVGADSGATRTPGTTEMTRSTGAAVQGSTQASAGLGLPGRARRGPASTSFDNARARPAAALSDPSIASVNEGRAGDTVESEQADAANLASLLHASTAGGAKGAGRGGENAKGAAGAGGERGAGQSASPLGKGGVGAGDIEQLAYVRAVQSKVHPFWADAFPKAAIIEGKSGLAIVTVVIEVDGSVSSARVSRASTVPEFDENVRRAVLQAAPYGPLPTPLRPRLTLALTFSAVNPAVRPKQPKIGPTD